MKSGLYQNFGHFDWRLPNIFEYYSLIDFEKNTPALPSGHPFTNIQVTYNTSTTAPMYLPDTSWTIIFEFTNGSGSAGPKSVSRALWPVRGGSLDGTINASFPANIPTTGQTERYTSSDDGDLHIGIIRPDPRFTDNGDDTVTDNFAGLMWTKSTRLASGVTWQNALDYVAGMNSGTYANFGHTDWRLPNITELMFMCNYGFSNPGLETGHPFTNISSTIRNWSSTTLALKPARAWCIFLTSNTTPGALVKDSVYGGVWAVRSITPSEGFLFPLQDVTAYTAEIYSVMDHSMTTPYTKDGVVLAFNGEEGGVNNGCWCYSTDSVCDPNNYTSCAVVGFMNVEGINFLDNVVNYNDEYLYYDGHPGYDYSTPTGTDIHAPESGTLCVATTTTQKPQPADLWRNTTKCPLSSAGITNWLSHHTFYIIHKNVLLNDSIDDYMTVFLHNTDLESSVRASVEQNGYIQIIRGQHVAESGEFGSPGAPHMHMETYKWNRTTSAWDRVDPYGDGVNNILWE